MSDILKNSSLKNGKKGLDLIALIIVLGLILALGGCIIGDVLCAILIDDLEILKIAIGVLTSSIGGIIGLFSWFIRSVVKMKEIEYAVQNNQKK